MELQLNCAVDDDLSTTTFQRRLLEVFYWATVCTRRPASADRTARRQFQDGKPVSRTQASDAITSRLPRYEAKCVQRRCFQCGPVPLRSDIKGTELPLPIYWYHSKGNWLRYNSAADSFYIMKLCSRFFVLYCRNCPKDVKFRYFVPILRKLGAAWN